MWITGKDAEQLESAETFRSPIPTRLISNGEYMPLPQTAQQREVERRLHATADDNAKRLGLSTEDYLRTRSGMAAAFSAMNAVHGNLWRRAARA